MTSAFADRSVVDVGATVLIVGASARAAAQSAAAAGRRAVAIDLFGDLDLRQVAEVETIDRDDYPRGLLEPIRRRSGTPVIYVGGLENHPVLIESIAETNPVLGVRGDELKRVRDSNRLSESLRSAGFRTPRSLVKGKDGVWIDQSTGESFAGKVIVKPIRSAGGRGVRLVDPQIEGDFDDEDEPFVAQEYVAGESMSAVYVGSADRAALRLFTSRQLAADSVVVGPGSTDQDENRFAYRGNVGPIKLSSTVDRRLDRLGDRMASDFGLVGLFGVDFILDRNDEITPIEVNPRFPASAELYDRLVDHLGDDRDSAIGLHLAAWAGATSSALEGRIAKFPPGVVAAKRIVRSPSSFVVGRTESASFGNVVDRSAIKLSEVRIADVPASGTKFEPSEPLCTLVTIDANERSALERINEAEAKTRGSIVGESRRHR